jgi:hypothetical protein
MSDMRPADIDERPTANTGFVKRVSIARPPMIEGPIDVQHLPYLT